MLPIICKYVITLFFHITFYMHLVKDSRHHMNPHQTNKNIETERWFTNTNMRSKYGITHCPLDWENENDCTHLYMYISVHAFQDQFIKQQRTRSTRHETNCAVFWCDFDIFLGLIAGNGVMWLPQWRCSNSDKHARKHLSKSILSQYWYLDCAPFRIITALSPQTRDIRCHSLNKSAILEACYTGDHV